MKHYFFKAHLSIIAFCFIGLLPLATSHGQSVSTAAPFLRIPPSALSLAMGRSGTAYSAGDMFSLIDGPAHLGILCMDNNLVISSYPSSAPILKGLQEDIGYTNHGFALGYNFGRDSGSLPLSIGVAYIYQDVNLGTFVRTLEDGSVLGSYHSSESANNISIAASLDLGVKLGIGFTYKDIQSNISPVIVPDSGVTANEGSAGAIDLGIFTEIPVISGLSINDDFSLDIGANLGLAIANIGSEMVYREESDPLPRMAKIGYTVSAGLNYKISQNFVKLLNIDWTCEAIDLIVRRDSLGSYYEPAFSDVNFIQNFLLLSSPNKESVRFGVSFTVLEIFRFMFGSYSNWQEWGTTQGFGIQLKGMLKLYSGLDNNSFVRFLAKHIDLALYFAKITEPAPDGTNGFEWDSFNIVLSMKNIF